MEKWFIIEARWGGVWSWENLRGAEGVEDAMVREDSLVADQLDPDQLAELALDAGVGPHDVRVRPATPEEIALVE